jgi:hypothetical protein
MSANLPPVLAAILNQFERQAEANYDALNGCRDHGTPSPCAECAESAEYRAAEAEYRAEQMQADYRRNGYRGDPRDL